MNSRAYDANGVVHLTPYKGAPLPSCFVAEEADEAQEPTRTSPMFLPRDTPITCVRCLMIEVEMANAPPESDD